MKPDTRVKYCPLFLSRPRVCAAARAGIACRAVQIVSKTKPGRAVARSEEPEPRIRARNEERILRAAVDLFADKGFHGTHVKEIAAVSGLPKTNVYYYFPTKESIYAALIERLIEGWDRAFEHIVVEREPREAIADYIRAKLDYSRRHAADSRFFANEILRGAQFLDRRQRKHIQDVTNQRAYVVEEWIRRKQMAPVDPRHFFIMLWSATQFYADFGTLAAEVLQKRHLTRKDFDAAAETMTRVILDGCMGPPEPQSP